MAQLTSFSCNERTVRSARLVTAVVAEALFDFSQHASAVDDFTQSVGHDRKARADPGDQKDRCNGDLNCVRYWGSDNSLIGLLSSRYRIVRTMVKAM